MKYTLVPLITNEELQDEGYKMCHALSNPVIIRSIRILKDRVYSLRNEEGVSILTLSVRFDNGVYHIAGFRNRPPTEQEFEILNPLLKEKGFQNKYDPSTLF